MKIVDMHCDTISKLWESRNGGASQEGGAALRENGGHMDLARMKESGYLLQNFALFVDTAACGDPWERVCSLCRLYQEEMTGNADLIAPVLKYEDIAENEAAGRMSAMLTVEEGAVCKGEVSRLRDLYKMGVRMLTLSWNYPNELGHPNLDGRRGKSVWGLCRELKEGSLDGETYTLRQKKAQKIFEDYFYMPDTVHGLTEKGREFVQEMESLGMIVDVSHLSDAGFYDVLESARRPFVASHSNARGVCRCARNLTDDMIKKLAERGGCMGLNFCADFLREAPVGTPNSGAIWDVVRHARHITNVGGMEVLGLGSDFDGIDTNEGLPGAQSMGLLWEALHRSGYTQGELDKIFGRNVLRVYRDVLG